MYIYRSENGRATGCTSNKLGDIHMKITPSKNYELIATLNKHVHDVHVEQYPDHFKPYNYDEIMPFYKNIIDTESYIFLVIEDENEAVGYAWIELKDYLENPFKFARKFVYVHQISISTHVRSKGYGSMLMAEIEAIAKANSITAIELDYWVKNEGAKRFYEKQDYIAYREFVYKEI